MAGRAKQALLNSLALSNVPLLLDCNCSMIHVGSHPVSAGQLMLAKLSVINTKGSALRGSVRMPEEMIQDNSDHTRPKGMSVLETHHCLTQEAIVHGIWGTP